MIELPCTYKCDTCDTEEAGVLSPQFMTFGGRPAGFQLAPSLPDGWSVATKESAIQVVGQQPTPEVASFVCCVCVERIEAAQAARTPKSPLEV